ncbi:MAG: BTAD domain-containing putative transcriptional regulator, partial [Geminicoccaceae bacterium]
MGLLQIHLLGGFELRRASGELIGLPTRKSRLLLAYLALAAGRPQPRGKLAALFWSDRAEPQARASLRQELHALRQSLTGHEPAGLRISTDAVALDPGAAAIDVVLFDELATRSDAESLGRAADLYRGDLLEGLAAREASIDDWLAPERRRLRDLATDTLAKLLKFWMADGTSVEAAAAVRRLLALEPAHEVAHRALMRLLARAGDRRAALRQYQRCRAILAQELGVEPEEETKRLYQELLRHPSAADDEYLAPVPSGSRATSTAPAPGGIAGIVPLQRAGARRRLTVAYIDLVGSTALATRLDPEELREVLERFDGTVTDIVAQFGGKISYRQGDGLLACFGWPWAHEDDGERAVRAAMAVVAAVAQLRVPQTRALACRVGIATGLVVVGSGADELAIIGEAPHLAARLQAMGEPSTVLICAATRAQLGETFTLHNIGHRQLKGYDVAVQAWLVIGDSAAEGRFEALRGSDLLPLVGRRAQLAQLMGRWRLAQGGDGQVVLLAGAAGIGKSRLVRALRERLVAQPHTQLGLFCSPHHVGTALHPVIRLLERAAGLQPHDSPELQFEKLAAMLARASGSPPDTPHVLAELLGIGAVGARPEPEASAARRKERMFAMLVQQLAGLAAQAPVLVLYDDVHWADPSTLELLQRVVEAVRCLPVLLVIAFRPDFVAPWAGLDHVTTVELEPLARADAMAMIEEVACGEAMPGALVERILDRADGVPLFIEELTRAVLAQGGSEVSVPVNLHGSLMVQLDRLTEGKQVAQIAAVIGREFSPRLLEPLCVVVGVESGPGLEQLVAAGLVHPTSPFGRETYAFKHALVRDAAYESLLGSQRQQLHARIAQILVRQFPAMAAEEPEVVADHFTKAGLAPESVHYFTRAAERAVARYANAEAIGHYRNALEQLAHLPEGPDRRRTELLLQAGLGLPLMASLGYSAPPVRQAFARARELCRELADGPALLPILFGLTAYYGVKSDMAAARPLAARCLTAARAAGDDDSVMAACGIVGTVEMYHGRLVAARSLFDRGLALYRPGRQTEHIARFGQDPIAALAFIARTEAMLGHPDLALRRAEMLVAAAQEPNMQPNTLGALHAHLAQLHLVLADPETALRHATAAVDVASRQDLPLWLGLGRMYRGVALLALAGADEALLNEGMREGLDGMGAYRATGAGLDVPTCLCWLAEGHARLGRPAAGLQMLGEALRIIADTGETYFAAEAHRLAAVLHLAGEHPDPVAAEASLQTSLAIARRQRARLW